MPYTYKYPHPAVTTDCVILTFHEGKLKVLLIRRGIEPYKGCWALPGGFLRIDESAEEGALRELREETGVTGCSIRQFHTFSAPGRDPRERVITIAFYALMKWQQATGADDAEFADWIPVDTLPKLAFDHEDIIRMALDTIRKDIFFEPVGFELLNEVFSMSDLQKVYEAILGKEFDRRNFAKKMKHLKIIEEVEEASSKAETDQRAFISKQEVKTDVAPMKELPLPFLNIRSESKETTNGVTFSDISIPSKVHEPAPSNVLELQNIEDFSYYDSDFCNCRCATAPVEEKSPKRRRSLLFRLNRKKYDTLKEDDTVEF